MASAKKIHPRHRVALPLALPLAAALASTACGPPQQASPPVDRAQAAGALCKPGDPSAAVTLAHDVSLRCISPGVWLFTALADAANDRYPANGLVIEGADGGVLIDTGWAPAQAEELVAWAARSLARPITAAVVTHFHVDRLGGASALEQRGIPVFATPETIALARAHGATAPDHALEPSSAPSPGLRWFFPGAGHSRDNIVVWHAPTRTLFGGCMIKDRAARALGNTADADLAAWPGAVERVLASFPEAALVVPGHGDAGGTDLLHHTLEMLTGDASSPAPSPAPSLAPSPASPARPPG